MERAEEIRKQLGVLRHEYRAVASMLSMMEKGTKLEDLVKMRKSQLDPISVQIADLEEELKLLVKAARI